ncbi:MAG: VOC family protein [Bacteroidota bacterium]
MSSALRPFHLAIPVSDLAAARRFYRDVIGCSEGRSDEHWVDFNFYGHQLVIHYKPKDETPEIHHNRVDGHDVPIPHFGVVLTMTDWKELAAKLEGQGVTFVIEPYIRFEGEPGEQATMFLLDPSGNALEFKAFQDLSGLFAK